MSAPPSTTPTSALPTWWVALLALFVSLATSLAMSSYKAGSMEAQIQANTTKVDALRSAYEADKAKRAADAEAKVSAYEAERAARMARIEQIADQLQRPAPSSSAKTP